MLKKIISGGQLGVDLGALYAAQYLGIEMGGYAPLGWMTEDGPRKQLLQDFGLIECMRPGYPARTEMNVQESHATLICYPGGKLTGGTYMTICCCESMGRPYTTINFGWAIDERDALFNEWLGTNKISVLNVAGPRESKWQGAQSLVMDWLIRALENSK